MEPSQEVSTASWTCMSVPWKILVYLSVPGKMVSQSFCLCLLICLSICLSVCLAHLFVSQSVYLFVSQSVSVPVYLLVCKSVCLFVGMSACLSVCRSVYLCVCQIVCLSVSLAICLSVCLSAGQPARQSIHPSICPSHGQSGSFSVFFFYFCPSIFLSIGWSESVNWPVGRSITSLWTN